MVVYNFCLGSAGFGTTTVKCETDGCGKIVSCDTSETSGKKGSLDVQVSDQSECSYDSVIHTIKDIKNMYKEILRVIAENELQQYQIPEYIDENDLLEKVLEDLEYQLECYSDNLSGYSDIISVTSGDSAFTVDEVHETYSDILKSLENTRKYLM